jgi:Cation efflux family
VAHAGLAGHRGRSRRRRGSDRRVGRPARVRPGQRHRGRGVGRRDLAFTGTRLASATSERHAQRLVAVSFYLLAPYIAIDAIRALATGDRAETSIMGIVLTAGTAVLEPALGLAKRRLGARLGSAATAGEGTQNLLCAYLAAAVLAGLLANTLFGAWWLDGVVALAISGWAVAEGRRAWAGRGCGCACQPDPRGLPLTFRQGPTAR